MLDVFIASFLICDATPPLYKSATSVIPSNKLFIKKPSIKPNSDKAPPPAVAKVG